MRILLILLLPINLLTSCIGVSYQDPSSNLYIYGSLDLIDFGLGLLSYPYIYTDDWHNSRHDEHDNNWHEHQHRMDYDRHMRYDDRHVDTPEDSYRHH